MHAKFWPWGIPWESSYDHIHKIINCCKGKGSEGKGRKGREGKGRKRREGKEGKGRDGHTNAH